MAAKFSPAGLRFQKYSVCERVSSVDPDFDAEMNRVRPRSSCRSRSRIACGCVVSRTWNVSWRKVRLITSGASDEPPMPRRTTSSTRSTTESANCISRSTSSRSRQGGPLGVDALDDLVEGVTELLNAFCLERLDDIVVVDARLAQLLDQLLRVRHPV